MSRSVVVAAPAEQVFTLLADPRRHAELDGSGTLRGTISGPPRLELGSRFTMRMHQFLPYRITNTVVEFEEGNRIAWRHFGRHVWRWELEPVEDDGAPGPATRVTETFDWAPALAPPALEVARIPASNAKAIRETLDRLAERFGRLSPTT